MEQKKLGMEMVEESIKSLAHFGLLVAVVGFTPHLLVEVGTVAGSAFLISKLVAKLFFK